MSPSFNISILLKKEDDLFIAHCLELDIVATSNTIEGAKEDILSLIQAQIEYAFDNDNLDNLFHPAPSELWREYYSCNDVKETRRQIQHGMKEQKYSNIPQWLVAKTCEYTSHHLHA